MSREKKITPKSAIKWADAHPIITAYEASRSVSTFPDSTKMLRSFFIQKEVIDQIKTSGAEELFIAFGFHQNQTDNLVRKGYSIILFGMLNGKIMLGPNDVIWDVLTMDQISSTHRQNISRTVVKSVLNYYRLNHPLKTFYLDNGNIKQETLIGHVIQKEDLIDLCSLDPAAIYIEFIMAYHTYFQYNSKTKFSHKGYTWVILGNSSANHSPQGRMIYEGNGIFDYCDPCPQKCPDNEHLLRE